MEPIKLTLSSDFQKAIIKQMLVEKSFALNCVIHLQADYFENKYLAWAFTKLKEYIEKYKEKPSGQYLVDQLKGVVEEEKESYKNVLKAILATELVDINYLKTELTQFIKTSEFKKMHHQQVPLFNAQKYDETFQLVTEHISKINKISFIDDSYVKIEQMDEILEKVTHSISDYVPTGITLIDKSLNGGMPKGSVTTILGSWNSGKSIVGINMVYYAAKAGKKVLYVFHEGRVEQVVIRFLSRITGIPYNELMAGAYREDSIKMKKIEDAKIFIKNHIRIREMRQVGVSVEDVYFYSKATMEDWAFDMLCCDYGMKLTTSKKSFREIRHTLGHIWNTFDLFSAELNIAVLTMAQLNREAVKFNRKGSQIIRSEGISECAQIAHVSETIITINKSSENEDNNVLIYALDKCRDARAGQLVECTTDFRRMKAHDEALGMRDAGWDIPTKDEPEEKDEK